MSYHYSYNKSLVGFASANRKKSTDTEKKLWRYLRNRLMYGYKFRRQYAIGRYILDFYCVEKKLAIELDGNQHLQNNEYDSKRTAYLTSLGIRVIRFWDNEVVENITGVLEKITEVLET
ncbi:MAG TPA: endonuclease domain-containing protein [Candidatus Saccharimonadales bacterium]|nr:endonuclease domain-containing protein [Candidatus Saccharimonadales bacterium]